MARAIRPEKLSRDHLIGGAVQALSRRLSASRGFNGGALTASHSVRNDMTLRSHA
jgi:hypothetical protein